MAGGGGRSERVPERLIGPRPHSSLFHPTSSQGTCVCLSGPADQKKQVEHLRWPFPRLIHLANSHSPLGVCTTQPPQGPALTSSSDMDACPALPRSWSTAMSNYLLAFLVRLQEPPGLELCLFLPGPKAH